MHRFYVDEAGLRGQTAALSPEDTAHALRVLRMREGDTAEIICGGVRYRAVLTDAENREARFELREPLPSTEPALRITLFQGLPKADKMEWVIQKAVEIGVSEIVPVRMTRCVMRLNEKDAEKKLDRWRRIAMEAGKQSGRCVIPTVASPLSLPDVLSRAAGLDACAVPWEDARSLGPKAFFSARPGLRSLGLLIGPEGGISPEEIEALSARFCPLTLGPRILRTETAGLAAAAAFFALAGEMEGALV